MVWEPVLLTDWTTPSSSALSLTFDKRAIQFWDKGLLLSQKIQADVKARPNHPWTKVCGEGEVVWDIVAVFPTGIRWDISIPEPTFVDGPVVRVMSDFRKHLSKLLGQKLDTPGSQGQSPAASLDDLNWSRALILFRLASISTVVESSGVARPHSLE